MNASDSIDMEVKEPLTGENEVGRFSSHYTKVVDDVEIFEPMTVEKLFYDILEKKKGGCGKYQWITSTAVMFGLICFGYIEYVVSYLELVPIIDCTIDGVF